MDLTKLNEASSREKATSIKDLVPMNHYIITELRNVDTKYGQQIIAELDGGQYIFLPSNTCKHLQKNLQEYLLLQDAANKLKLLVQPLGGFKIKFDIM